MKLALVTATCIILAALAAPLGHTATPQARKDAQVKAFFAHHAKLARTPAGRIALLQVKVRALGAQVRSLQAVKSLHVRAEWDADAARELGRSLAMQRGWSTADFDCVDQLFGPLESSWNVHADNPRSDAYGIPQALPGSKMGVGWESSAEVQILWGYDYVSKYGGPCGALSFRLNNGWY